MKKYMILAGVFVFGLLFLVAESVIGGRGGRGGGGGGRGGGVSTGSVSRSGGVVQSYGGGSGSAARSSAPIVGPGGGSGGATKSSGSYTTKGGSTVDYRGGTAGGTTGGGTTGAKHVGGVQVTTPGGREVTNVGKSGVAQGPGGNVVGGKSGTTVGTGPQGAVGNRYQGGVAIGPQGGVAGKTQGGIATGPNRTAVGGTTSGVVSGPYGTAGARTTAAAGTRGTYYRSSTAIRNQGVYVRQGVATYPCFRSGWYTQNPGAWFATGWVASSVWRPVTWVTCSSYCGIPSQPVYYDYGETVIYQDNSVYISGEKVASAEQYYQQANTLADTGRDAKVTKEEEWLPLGVFAVVSGEEKNSNHIFQLAVNKQGVIRGNYYDAVTDTSSQVFGSVDQKTQRAGWSVGDRKTPVFEAGIANLTKNETTMLVHYGQDRSQQFTLIRIEEPEMNPEKK